jgi:hypothetical protein
MELHQHFKDKYYFIKIGFSKFSELSPQHYIFPGFAGMQAVCVCLIHQKIKPMIDGARIAVLTAIKTLPTETYYDCVARIVIPYNCLVRLISVLCALGHWN